MSSARPPRGPDRRGPFLAGTLIAATLAVVGWGLSALVGWLRLDLAPAATVSATAAQPATSRAGSWWSRWSAPASEPETPSGVPEDNPYAKTRMLGRVFDVETGEGISGALVTVRPTFGEPRLGPSSGEGSVAFTTAPDGTFALRGIPPGHFDLVISASGFVTGRSAFKKLSAIEDDEGMELPLVRSSAVEGRVVDARGAPVAGARIAVLRPGEPRVDEDNDAVVTTGSDGRFLLDPADALSLELFVTHPRHPPVAQLVPPSDAPSRTVEIVLPAGTRVTGIVRDAHGPIEGARVLPEYVRADDRLVLFSRNEGDRFGVRTDASGRFELAAPVDGALSLRAEADGYQRQSERVPSSPGPSGALELDFFLQPGAEMSGRILSTAGEPLARAHILVLSPEGGYGEQETGPDGVFRLRGLPAAGPYEVRIRHHAHPPFATQEPELRGTHEYRLEAQGRILGRIVDARTGTPVTRYDYHLLGPVRARSGAVSLTGSFEVDQLVAGTYTLLIGAEGFEPASVEGLVVSPGETVSGVEVRLHRSASISGRVLGVEDGELLVQAFGPSGRFATAAMVEPGGGFVLENLRQGTYSLKVVGDGFRGEVDGIAVELGARITGVEIPVHPSR